MFLILLTTVLSFAARVSASPECPSALEMPVGRSVADQAVDALSTLEARVRATTMRSLAADVSSTDFETLYREANEAIERALSILTGGVADVSHTRSKIRTLVEITVRLEAMVRGTAKSESRPELDLRNRDLKSLVPDRLYEVNGLDPFLRRVSFSASVLENVLQSDCPLMVRASELFIKAIHRGRAGATEKSGVKPMRGHPDLFRVKITGGSVGAVRLAGFFDKTDFHVVAWENESYHNLKSVKRLGERLRSMREKFFTRRL